LLHQSQDGRPAQYTEVDTIAAYYLDEVRKVQPHGPYFLGVIALALWWPTNWLSSSGNEDSRLRCWCSWNPLTRRIWTKHRSRCCLAGISPKWNEDSVTGGIHCAVSSSGQATLHIPGRGNQGCRQEKPASETLGVGQRKIPPCTAAALAPELQSLTFSTSTAKPRDATTLSRIPALRC